MKMLVSVFIFETNSLAGVSYRNLRYLSAHELSDCGRLPIYKCDECGKSFATPYSLNTHKNIHTNTERNVPCTQCGKKFRNRGDLKLHLKRHVEEKPFQCDHCKKRFSDMAYMKAHMGTHLGVKRHICYGCGARFMTNSALHKHRKYRQDTCALMPIQPPTEKKGELPIPLGDNDV